MAPKSSLPSTSLPKGKPRTAPPPSSSQASGSSSSQAEPPKPPSATSALDALDQAVETIKQYPKKHLAQKRKDEVIALINLAHNLFVSETATLQAGGPVPSGAPPSDLVSLLVSVVSTEWAVASLRGDIQQAVKMSVQEALKSMPPVKACATPPAPQPAHPPRDGPHHLDVTIGIPPASWSDSLTRLSTAQLKSEVDAALNESGIAGLKDARVRGIRRLPNGNLLAADGAVPVAKLCPYSKCWWTPELTALKRAACRLSNCAARHRASPEDAATARTTSYEYHTAIRRQKCLHWRTYIESAMEQTIWQASKYVTQAPEDTLASRLPALKLSDGSVAQSCSEKWDTLMAQFFPAPPPASLSDIAEAEYDDQLQFMPFSGEEVEAALENLSPFKAPGPSGVPNAALKECSDRQRLSLSYIDDTAIVVTSPSVAINIRILTEIIPLLLNWSCMHACRFDIGKFQLVHHTHYEPRYEPLPLQIDGHTIIPSKSAKYLGIIVNRRLQWHEHIEAAIAKGGGLSPAGVWTPGMVYPGMLKEWLPQSDRVDLLPIELHLNQATHHAATRLASLPDSHPLYKAIQ
ncbi:hypothetical protein V8D89_006401 [Ganoderma adspersum]